MIVPTELRLDEFKINLLRDLVQDALRDAQRGETSYGSAQDQADAVEALQELAADLAQVRVL